MKTAISIPDRLFAEAERLAAQRGMSRSELYTRAVEAFVESQKGLGVRERLDAVYATNPEDSLLDPPLARLQSRSLQGSRQAPTPSTPTQSNKRRSGRLREWPGEW